MTYTHWTLWLVEKGNGKNIASMIVGVVVRVVLRITCCAFRERWKRVIGKAKFKGIERRQEKPGPSLMVCEGCEDDYCII